MEITRGAIFLPLTGGTLTGALLLPNGTVATPALSFANDTDTGLYLNAPGELFIGTGGAARIQIEGGNIYSRSSFYPLPTGSLDCGTGSYRWRDFHLNRTFYHGGAVHRRTEAKITAGASYTEAVTWTVAFAAAPAVACSAVDSDSTTAATAQISSVSTTGATILSLKGDAQSSRVKHVIAQEVT